LQPKLQQALRALSGHLLHSFCDNQSRNAYSVGPTAARANKPAAAVAAAAAAAAAAAVYVALPTQLHFLPMKLAL
jgi:hypothetical protein